MLLLILLTFLVLRASSLGGPTDTYTWGGNYMRHGYQTNHNMDPSVVGSANFGQIFKAQLPGNFKGIAAEQIFSQPLVFTGNDGIQYIFISTTQNNLYKLNAKTGAIVASRNLHVPFLTADLEACTDIQPTVGITATGTIDPSTGIWYLSSKTYSEQFQSGLFSASNPPGRENGRYWFHGIDTQSADLSDAFAPVSLEGRTFRNNPNRMFNGGIHHSRPGLVLAGDYVYTAFASHCVLWNFTGAVIGHNKRTGAIVEMFATQGGPEPNSVRGGGIWMSGGGISYDGAGSLFFSTGNGYASQLSNTPVPGRQPPSALEEAAVNAKINDDGTLTVIDFFMPWEKQQLDGADKDLGTTPLQLLPPDVFTCPNVRRMGIVTGKSGKTYVLNLDNLGGYQMGLNRLDSVVFMYQHENSVYAGAGVMPLGGGYIYINVIRYQTRVFKFSCDGNGNPQLTVVAHTKEMNAYILGTGHGTTTSLNGREGTGLFWLADIEGVNVRIYDAIPRTIGGNLTLINSFNAPGLTKFTRPVFGDGIAYYGTTTGHLYAFGSPVNLPLNCSSPYEFGRVPLKNRSAPLTITCLANVATTVTGVELTGNPNFNLSSLPAANLQLAKGASFSFRAIFSPQAVGPLSSDAVVNTTNSIVGYSTNTPVALKGTGSSAAPLLAVGPNTVSFNIIAGEQTGGVNQSSVFSNVGDSLLTIRNIAYSLKSEKGPWVRPNIISTGVQVGPFTFLSLPTTIPANGQSTATINYNPTVAGNDACFFSIVSDGGIATLDVVAVAGTYPTAVIEFEKFDGTGWTKLDNSSTFSFGNVTENQTRSLRLRVTNNGSASAVPLSITVSKPPVGVQGIVGAVNNIDLGEGTIIAAGQSATATLYCSVPKSQYNIPAYSGSAQWVMNTADVNLGKQTMTFACTAVAEQVGPLFANGSARFGYVGCYRENNPGRQLAYQAYGDSRNTIERCVNLCSSAGWIFAATQYQQECWCGNAIPVQGDTEPDCNYQCTGSANQTCGGNGYFADQSRMSLFADLTVFQNVTSPPLSIPQSVGQYKYIGCYSQRNGKAMNSKSTSDPKLMSVSRCATFCSEYNALALEFAQECYCGAGVNTQFATLTSDSSCMTMTCKGNNSEFCGAANLAQVYSLNGVRPSSTSSLSASISTRTSSVVSASSSSMSWLDNYMYLGCFNETHDRRALNERAQDISTNTLSSCATFCQGFNYFGVEYSSQCYCGNVLYAKSIKQQTEVGCSMQCSGNSSQTCGGPDFLNVYYTNPSIAQSAKTSSGATPSAISGPSAVPSVGGFGFIGCYNEVGGRALTGRAVANSSMTVDLCAAFCSSFDYFGVEYASECYCGNFIASGSTASTTGSCTMVCAANSNQYCGGPAWLSMYRKNSTAPSSSSMPSSVSISSTTSGLPASSGVPGWTPVGCWTDNVGGRALSSLSANSGMTLNMCANTAQSAGATYFGVEYGSECWYGTAIGGNNVAAPASECSFACPGNSAQICGAGNRLSLWQLSVVSSSTPHTTTSASVSGISSTASISPSSTAVPARIGDYTSLGCYNDNASGVRALSTLNANDSMTLDLCASQAQSSSAQYFGVEYGRECWTGSTIGGTNAMTSQSSCNMRCPGNQLQWCGAGNFLQLYTLSPVALSSSVAHSSSLPSMSQSSSTAQSSASINTATFASLSSRSSAPISITLSSSTLVSRSSSRSIGSTSITSTSGSSTLWASSAAPTISASLNTVPSTSIQVSSSFSTSSVPSSATSILVLATSGTGALQSSSLVESSSYMSSLNSSVVPTSFRTSAPAASSSSSRPQSYSSSVSSTASPLPSSPSSSTTSAGPSTVPSSNSYDHVGCYNETSGRALNATSMVNSTGMTVTMCSNFCSAYAYFGVEYGSECYCGPYLRANSGRVLNQGDCTMLCAGDRSTFCGAGSRLNVYFSSNESKVSNDPISPQRVGEYNFYNCVNDSPRLLASKILTSKDMSAGLCMDRANAGDYRYAGLQYGTECWAGNEFRAPLVNATAGACNMVCGGSVGEICGAGSRLSLYIRG